MEAFAVVASGASLGFASIPHCIGMCGGIASACSRTRGSSLTYQGARLFAYVAIGAFAGLALGPVRAALPHGTWAIAFGAVTAAALVFSGVRLLRARPVPPAFVPVTALRRERARRRARRGGRHAGARAEGDHLASPAAENTARSLLAARRPHRRPPSLGSAVAH